MEQGATSNLQNIKKSKVKTHTYLLRYTESVMFVKPLSWRKEASSLHPKHPSTTTLRITHTLPTLQNEGPGRWGRSRFSRLHAPTSPIHLQRASNGYRMHRPPKQSWRGRVNILCAEIQRWPHGDALRAYKGDDDE